MDLAPESITDGLTAPQAEAVTHVTGPLLVLAGPGSGKTTVVTRRVAHLIGQGIPAPAILGLTFTNKAAGEMRDRVERRLPPDLPGRRGLTIATFHSFCARLLRRYAEPAGVAPRFSVYDTADQRAAAKRAISEAGLSERNFTPAAVLSAISRAKNQLLDAAGYAAEANDFYARSMARAYTQYEKTLRQSDALDYDDLLLVAARLLRSEGGVGAAVCEELRRRYEYLLVDEYQDTNHAQFVIANALAARHRNICVVGDPDQSIYGWRGADIRNILEFEQHYPEATVIPLGENFRSTGHVVAVADHLIRHNKRRKHKPLHTSLDDGEKPTVIVCRDETHEATLVVDDFRRRHEDGIAWKDMAVLYRMNALSRVLEEAFRDAQVPYVIARGTAFYDRKEIKDALSYMRLIANSNDATSLLRIINTPARGIGKTSLDRIEAFARGSGIRTIEALRRASAIDGLSPRSVAAVSRFVAMLDGWLARTETGADATAFADLVEHVVRESGLETLYRKSRAEEDLERLENLEELINAAAQFEPPVDPPLDPGAEADAAEIEWTLGRWLDAYLESVALVSDADMIDPANGAVTLMTLHAAKGLEFEAVAIVGLEGGLLPHHRAAESEHELEEERRLCFVGITRAKRFLTLSRAHLRTHRGLRERTIPSQFIDELPADDVVASDQGAVGALDAWDAYDDPVWEDRSGPGRGRGRGQGRGQGQGPSRRGRSLVASFPAGTLVRHPTFGLGRVDSVLPRPAGASARVTFESVGTKTLILEYARLERV